MIGTLLKDVATGMDFATVSARFASKMHPLKYQRPQAAPRVGNIADAEKIVARLGIARSLERRFARIDEIDTLWKYRPVPEVPDRVRVFSRLVARGDTAPMPLDVPPITMTLVKFAATVLPTLESLELRMGRAPTNTWHWSRPSTSTHPDSSAGRNGPPQPGLGKRPLAE